MSWRNSTSSMSLSQPGASGRRKSPTSSWYRVTPRAYTSLLMVADCPATSSGARYKGVPLSEDNTWVWVRPSRVMSSSSSTPESNSRLLPKSATRRRASAPSPSISRLAGFRSLCSTPTLCAAATASAACANSVSRCSTDTEASSPLPGQRSMLAPPYSDSMKYGACSKSQSSARTKSSRSPSDSRSRRATVTSRFSPASPLPARLNLNTRASRVLVWRASQTSLPPVRASADSSRQFGRRGTASPASSLLASGTNSTCLRATGTANR